MHPVCGTRTDRVRDVVVHQCVVQIKFDRFVGCARSIAVELEGPAVCCLAARLTHNIESDEVVHRGTFWHSLVDVDPIPRTSMDTIVRDHRVGTRVQTHSSHVLQDLPDVLNVVVRDEGVVRLRVIQRVAVEEDTSLARVLHATADDSKP